MSITVGIIRRFFSTQTYDVILEQKIANTEIIMTGELFFTVIYELFVGSGIMTISTCRDLVSLNHAWHGKL